MLPIPHMPIPHMPIHDMPGHLVRRLHQIHAALFAEECGAQGLTSLQYAALAAMRAQPGIDATRLSGLTAIDRSTLGGVLDRLEAKGWARRGADAGDRRVKLLWLTAAGEALLDAVDAAVRRVQHRLVAPLAEADRLVFVRLMAEVARAHNDATSAPLRLGRGPLQPAA